MFSTALLLAASMVVGQSGEDAFKSYTDFAIGGVWTTTVDKQEPRTFTWTRKRSVAKK